MYLSFIRQVFNNLDCICLLIGYITVTSFNHSCTRLIIAMNTVDGATIPTLDLLLDDASVVLKC